MSLAHSEPNISYIIIAYFVQDTTVETNMDGALHIHLFMSAAKCTKP